MFIRYFIDTYNDWVPSDTNQIGRCWNYPHVGQKKTIVFLAIDSFDALSRSFQQERPFKHTKTDTHAHTSYVHNYIYIYMYIHIHIISHMLYIYRYIHTHIYIYMCWF